MRGLVVTVLVIAALFVGLGFYLGWFNVTTRNTSDGGETNVNLTIDREKMKSDASNAKEKLHDLGTKAGEKLSPTK